MAETGKRRRKEPLPAHQSLPPLRQQKWKVEFARFFAVPRGGPWAHPPAGLRHISRGQHRHRGTWLPAASPAELRVSRPSHPSAAPLLIVSIGDVVYEEHFVSILNFSWPQVTCVTQCPIRGSRVVLMSFCDKYKKIQKFSVRFPQLSDTESFLNFIKECSRDTLDIIPSASDSTCEDSSASQYISSNGLHHRPDEAASCEEPASDHKTDALALYYHKEPDQPVTGPPANCSTDNEKDATKSYPVTFTNHAPEEAYILDVSHDVVVAAKETAADKGKGAGEDIGAKEAGDIVAQIKSCMTSNSFNDMLFMFDQVIDELGGDMSL